MIIVRTILILMIVYLLVKGFIRSLYLEDPPDREPRRDDKQKSTPKKVSKEIGDYVDYEEVE